MDSNTAEHDQEWNQSGPTPEAQQTMRVHVQYQPLFGVDAGRVKTVKLAYAELLDRVNGAQMTASPTSGRYFALARTALEESCMWAVKALTE
jgi:hypothetical protein